MPAVTRKGDSCTGHSCFPPRNSTSGSPNVFVNGKPAHRQGDSWETHCCTHTDCPHGCHSGSLASGSSSVSDVSSIVLIAAQLSRLEVRMFSPEVEHAV